MKEFNDEHLGQECNDLHDISGDLAKRTFDENADPISSTKLRKSKSVVAMKVSTLAALATLGIAISVGGVNIAVSGSSSTSTTKTYTVTNIPIWVYNEDCVLFSWAWNSTSGEQAFYTIKETNGTSVSTELPNDIDGFLLVRCQKDTVTPDWTIGTGDSAGRIYHQTTNIDVIEGTLSYECPTWLASPNEYCPGCD